MRDISNWFVSAHCFTEFFGKYTENICRVTPHAETQMNTLVGLFCTDSGKAFLLLCLILSI